MKMQTPKKYSTNQKIDIILEPATLYNSVTEIKPKESED